MDLGTRQETGLGRRFGEFILQVTRGGYDGKLGRSRLIGETGLSVEAGDLTKEGQRLILREWMHPRRQAPPRKSEDGARLPGAG